MMVPQCVPDKPSPAALARFRAFFEPYLYWGGDPPPAGEEKWQCDWLHWPATPPPGFTEQEEWKWLQVGGHISGLGDDDGDICINRPCGDLLFDVVYCLSQETGWIMYDGLYGYAVNEEQIEWWLRHKRTLEEITQVLTLEDWRRWHGV